MEEEILILGIGNVLLGDEGVGVHIVRALEGETLPGCVRLLDGGTGGFHLLSLFQQYQKIILIDATLDRREPGTIRLLKPKYARDFPQTLSAHDIGLKDLVQSAIMLGFLPDILLITVSITDNQPLSMELSEQVKQSIDEVINMVMKILEELKTKN